MSEILEFGVQPSEVERLDNDTRFHLLHHVRRLRALRRLQFMWDLACLMNGGTEGAEDRKDYQIALVREAFSDDPETFAKVLYGITTQGSK